MNADLMDVRVTGRGQSLVQLHMLSQAARAWVEEKVDAEPYMFLGDAVCVEHRYVDDIISGMLDAGLVVED